MAIPERDRRNLYDGLERALGPDSAETLMQLLPDEPPRTLVTSDEMHRELGALSSDLQKQMADLKTELKGDMADLRTEVKGDILRVENSLTTRMADLQTGMNRWALGITSANVLGMVTAILV